jgi:hypothetical protein
MYFDEHGVPHFHAYYGEFALVVELETLKVLEGHFPQRALAMVLEWASQHREELMENWRFAEAHKALKKIAPLE